MKLESKQHIKFLKRAALLAGENAKRGGGPFAAIIVKNNNVIAEAVNQVTDHNDPTAHAEMQAIRKAASILQDFQLTGCTIYSSCEPCPMCLGAIYWAHIDRLYYSNTKQEAASIGFDDAFIYRELDKPVDKRKIPTRQISVDGIIKPFEIWEQNPNKTEY